jgi:hypothetical protein
MTEELRFGLALLVVFVPIIAFYFLYNYVQNYGHVSKEVRIMSAVSLGIIFLFILPKWIQIGLWMFLLLLIWIFITKNIWDWLSSKNRQKLHIWYDKRKAVLILNGIIFLYLIFLRGEVHIYGERDSLYILQTLLLTHLQNLALASGAVALILIGLRNNVITDAGIFVTGLGLIKWSDILSYRWVGKHDNTLALKIDRRIKLFQEVPIIISPNNKALVRKLVQEHRPAFIE